MAETLWGWDGMEDRPDSGHHYETAGPTAGGALMDGTHPFVVSTVIL